MAGDASAEDRLRELLRDQEWYLRTRPDVMVRVRRAARRQRIKTAGMAACTAAAIASAAVTVPLTVSGAGGPAATTHSVPPSPVPSSTPPARVMPSVLGLDLPQAEAVLRQALRQPHFTVRYAQGSQPAGTILAQTPAVGSHVGSGIRVTLVVCD